MAVTNNTIVDSEAQPVQRYELVIGQEYIGIIDTFHPDYSVAASVLMGGKYIINYTLDPVLARNGWLRVGPEDKVADDIDDERVKLIQKWQTDVDTLNEYNVWTVADIAATRAAVTEAEAKYNSMFIDNELIFEMRQLSLRPGRIKIV